MKMSMNDTPLKKGGRSPSHLELPPINGYTIIGTTTYLADKQKRPLSLSSIKDLRVVKEEKATEPREDEQRTRLRSLVLATTALAKFRSHATMKRKEKKSFHRQQANSPTWSHENIRVSRIDMEGMFSGPVMRLNISSDVEIEHRKPYDESEKNGRASPTSATLARRLYIQEGPVKLSSATSTNDRYFFLFNDLLLIAKPKSTSTFKLKERVKVSEIWLAACIDDVTEATVIHDRAFVIGWPTTNYVAAFNSTEEKELWYRALNKSINEKRDQEDGKEVTIKVCNRTNANEESFNLQSASFPVTSKQDARDVIKMALQNFQYQNEDPSDYQLWFSSKDTVPYALIGHELPHAIKMNHVRSAYEQTHDENDNQFESSVIINENRRCQFDLRKAKKSGNRVNQDLANAQRKWKNPIKKSPIINWAMHKKTVKSPYSQLEVLPPGKLFGNSLCQLSTDEELIPKPVQVILFQLFRKGPATTGIFRKSALARTAKQIRQSLDQGKEVDLEDKSAIVLATVLKDFFRSMPDSLISSELYDDLVATKTLSDSSARSEQLKKIFQNLQKENYELTMKFLCALYHIQRFSDRNNMNSYNLSICVSPSIMWPPTNSKLAVTEQASGSSDVVCFLIDNYIEIFSKENEYILGEETDIQLQDGPGEDSDSGTDQFIYRCRQTSMEDTEDDQKNDSEKENEPPTPPFVIPVDETNLESPFAHSDSSLGTNDSDDAKGSLTLNVPSISVAAGTISMSKSNPSSPTLKRKEMLGDIKQHHSDMSDHETNEQAEQFQRKLLRQPRNKRVLSSTTTSAELIEHKRHVGEPKPPPKAQEKKQIDEASRYKTDCENTSNSTRCTSPADKLKVAKKSVISQPMIQHFATEFFPTPNVIFHSVDRRRQPAAPSYEEHIQRTQAKHRIIQSTTVKQPVIAHATLVKKQPVETYQPLKPLVKATAEKLNTTTTADKNNIETDKETGPNALRISKANNASPSSETLASPNSLKRENKTIDDRFNLIVDTINLNMPVSKSSKNSSGSTSSVSSLSSNMTTSSIDASPPSKDTVQKVSSKTREVEDGRRPLVNILPTAPKPNRSKIQKLDLKSNSSRTTSSDSFVVTDLTPMSENDNVFLSPAVEKSPIFENRSAPQLNSPFSLTLKADIKKTTSPNSLHDQALLEKPSLTQLEKTSLTKAPMKLEQLRNNGTGDGGRALSARELRRTNRRLKSEIRSAFNDGKFVCKPLNGKGSLMEANLQSKTLKTNLNGHFHGFGLSRHDAKTSVAQKNQENLQKKTTDLLKASKHRYNENNNLEKFSPSQHEAYKRILSQDESYV